MRMDLVVDEVDVDARRLAMFSEGYRTAIFPLASIVGWIEYIQAATVELLLVGGHRVLLEVTGDQVPEQFFRLQEGLYTHIGRDSSPA